MIHLAALALSILPLPGLSVSSALAAAAVVRPAGQDERKRADYAHLNVDKHGLALDGYDPVAYFKEGGGKPTRGDAKITFVSGGVTWRFASEKNRELFKKTPARFEPAYGGWCAWAMAKGEKVEVDPTSFLIEDGRLLVFYDGFFNDTRKKWLKEGGAALKPKAVAAWKKFLAAKTPPPG